VSQVLDYFAGYGARGNFPEPDEALDELHGLLGVEGLAAVDVDGGGAGLGEGVDGDVALVYDDETCPPRVLGDSLHYIGAR